MLKVGRLRRNPYLPGCCSVGFSVLGFLLLVVSKCARAEEIKSLSERGPVM
jgi:hypothetical protein